MMRATHQRLVVGAVWPTAASHPSSSTTPNAPLGRTATPGGPRTGRAAGRVLAHRAVGVVLGVEPSAVSLHARCPVCGGAHGKPVVVGHPEIGLSIAHAGECVGVAVAEGAQVGLDVEREIPLSDLLNPGAGVLHPLERDALAALPPGAAHARLPALLDAQGGRAEGDGRGPDDRHGHAARVPAGRAARGAGAMAGGGAREVRLHDLEPGPGYAACVAALTDLPLQVTKRAAGRR